MVWPTIRYVSGGVHSSIIIINILTLSHWTVLLVSNTKKHFQSTSIALQWTYFGSPEEHGHCSEIFEISSLLRKVEEEVSLLEEMQIAPFLPGLVMRRLLQRQRFGRARMLSRLNHKQ